ncbi:MAG TPA: hypothetical protein VJN71_06185 [Nitrososphaerales archaeon]|nr:hypothetical protein [Nitrososphaerales archaeon]
MLSGLVLILIVAAIGLAIAAEVLIVYERHSIKKRMREELDQAQGNNEQT